MPFVLRFLFLCSLALGALILGPGSAAHAQDPNPPPNQKLRVALKVTEPFVFENAGRYSGFSVDYWEKLAEALEVQYEFVLVNTMDAQVESVRDGRADVALSALDMTTEREKLVDSVDPNL